MIRPIEGLAPGIVGLRALGRVVERDYEEVVEPTLDRAVTEGGAIRLFLQLGPELESVSHGAMFHDAALGVAHWSDFDRIAVLTDDPMVSAVLGTLALALPCPIRVFPLSEFSDAKSWIEQDEVASNMCLQRRDSDVLVARPLGRLTRACVEKLADAIETVAADRGEVPGLLLDVERFPGWSNFAAVMSHLRLVSEHHRHVHRVALLTDTPVGHLAPRFLGHLVDAEVRHFGRSERSAALRWLEERG